MAEMGGINAFVDYERQIQNSAQVASAADLISDEATTNLLNKKLGVQVVPTVRPNAPNEQMTEASVEANEAAKGASVEILSAEAKTTEGADEQIVEKDKMVKQADMIPSSSTGNVATDYRPTSTQYYDILASVKELLEEEVSDVVTNIISNMVNQQRASVIRQMRQVMLDEREARTADAIKLTVYVVQIKQQREMEFKVLMEERMNQIQQLQVFLMNSTENLQKAEEKFDKLFRTLSAAMESTKAELTEAIRQKVFNQILFHQPICLS